jgi:hypothetical protein
VPALGRSPAPRIVGNCCTDQGSCAPDQDDVNSVPSGICWAGVVDTVIVSPLYELVCIPPDPSISCGPSKPGSNSGLVPSMCMPLPISNFEFPSSSPGPFASSSGSLLTVSWSLGLFRLCIKQKIIRPRMIEMKTAPTAIPALAPALKPLAAG